MSNLSFFIGSKIEIPSHLAEFLPTLMQAREAENTQLPAASLAFYEKKLKEADSKFHAMMWFIGIDETKRVIGYGFLFCHLEGGNLDRIIPVIYIRPEERRKGYARLMMQKMLKNIPSQIETVEMWGIKDTPGELFIKNFFKTEKPSAKEFISVSNIRNFNVDEVKKLAYETREKALKQGYELLFVSQGDFSKMNYQAYIRLEEEITNDMPKEDLSKENYVYTEEMHQERYVNASKLGEKYYTYALIDKETNKPIAFTELSVTKLQPTIAWQYGTGVISGHRGKGLGLALKYQSLEKLLTETEVEHWRTGNASVNEFMMRVNNQLGYKPLLTEVGYEVTREKWEELIG